MTGQEHDDGWDRFTIQLPDIKPTRRQNAVFWVKAHMHIWKLRAAQRLGRGPKTHEILIEAMRREQRD